ncbi:MAG: aminotransferase class I/II-fold pyridoxal phosphate-dependent enzyme, partial [Alphaproteobacteria bacterium]
KSFFQELERAVRHAVPPPTVLLLSYPSNPTALVADLDFYRDVVAFAKRHDIFVVSDLAYSEIYFDGVAPPSILEVPGARDIAVEFGSLSKTYSMPGWRVGYGVGNKDLIGALARVKSYLDYGAFTPIQVAATAALNGPQDCVEDVRTLYRQRRDVLCESFGLAGWDVPPPPATMFAWAPIPEQFRELGSLGFAKLLLEEADVAVSPGVGFGERGEGHVRLALVENRHRIRQAARGVKQFLARVRDSKDAADMAERQAARQAEAAE